MTISRRGLFTGGAAAIGGAYVGVTAPTNTALGSRAHVALTYNGTTLAL